MSSTEVPWNMCLIAEKTSDPNNHYMDPIEILALTYLQDPEERRRALQQMCPCHIMEGDMLWDRIIEMTDDEDPLVRAQALDFLYKLDRLYSDPDAKEMDTSDQQTTGWKRALAAAAIGGGTVAVIGGGAIVGALLAPLALPALGFGAAGVTAGSIAAAIQTPTIAAGSLFAIAQSAGATGAAAGTITAIGAGVGAGGGTLVAGGGALGGFLWKVSQKMKKMKKTQ